MTYIYLKQYTMKLAREKIMLTEQYTSSSLLHTRQTSCRPVCPSSNFVSTFISHALLYKYFMFNI